MFACKNNRFGLHLFFILKKVLRER